MGIDNDDPGAKQSVQTTLKAIFVSLELSRSSWVITSLSPGGGEKMSRRSVRAGDIAGLFDRFTRLRDKARVRTGQAFPIVAIQEASTISVIRRA